MIDEFTARARLAEVLRHGVGARGDRLADHQPLLLGAEIESVLGEDRDLGDCPRGFGVDQQAIAVEDDGAHPRRQFHGSTLADPSSVRMRRNAPRSRRAWPGVAWGCDWSCWRSCAI